MVESCTLLTTDASEALVEIHDRIPVILPRVAFVAWLDPASEPERLKALLRPYPAESTGALPVSAHVNNVRNDDAACIRPTSAS